MTDWQDTLNNLREALELTPDNVPLRAHVGRLYLDRGLLKEAEALFKEGLARASESEKLKLGLAQSYFLQGKSSTAIVIVEELVQRPDAAADAHLLYARLLLKSGQVEKACRAYGRAIDKDPAVADEELARAVGYDIKDREKQRNKSIQAEHPSIFEDEDSEDDLPWQDDDIDEFGRVRLKTDRDDDDKTEFDLEKPKITFDDVGGMANVKEEIQIKIIAPLKNPEIYKAYGKAIGGGILMYGPPGCGKTYLARATAGHVNASFLSVGIHDVLQMYIGASEHRLHALFEHARSNSPCILFFDEVDALGASRTDMRQSAGRQLINQFLAELDGVQDSNDGVLILAATNAPWHLDSAFRRPGRFDRIIFVPPPDEPARADILRVLLKGKPVENVDVDAIAKKTREFSGADLKSVIDVAVEEKLRDAMKTGTPAPLRTKDLLKAAKNVKPSTKEWFASAKNYALYSNEGGRYDDILEYLKMK